MMKSKLPACFFISSAFRETTTSSAPSRSASSFLLGDVVKTADVSSERTAKLHRHVTESSESHHANLLAFASAPVAHRRVCGDPRAEERRGSSDIQVRRQAAGQNVHRRRCYRNSRRR